MGNICVKPQKNSEDLCKKQFSWEVKESNSDRNNYMINGFEGEEVVYPPGSINGQQFLIQNCRNAHIYIFDYINTITVDDCEDCIIVIGAVKASVFLRNCIGSTCITCCGQFRSRDCRKCLVFIHCATQPIIEASTGMKFGTYELNYSALPNHLKEAGLKTSVACWREIHDFTPISGESNWSFIDMKGVKFTLTAKTFDSEFVMNELGVSWMGQAPLLIVHESTV